MSVVNFDKIFQPKSIAVVGASNKRGSVGNAIMRNLIHGGFQGAIYPINPKHGNLWNMPAYRSIRDCDNPVDLAVIASPIRTVPSVITDCVAHQISGAVVISAGGKETGAKGLKVEAAINEAVGDSGLRIIGPNCLGIIGSQAKVNASFAAQMPSPGKMAFISQSGAICTIVLDMSIKEKIGFSYFVSLGSMMDVDFGDVIDYLGGDSHVSSIVMYIENITHVRKFMSAARAVSRIKPIVALKAGRTAAGARAAASHTGALAGVDEIYEAAFKRAGIVRVKTFEELFDCAELLAKKPKLFGTGLAIITNSGGPGVMAADTLSDYGLEPVELSNDTLSQLDRVLSSNWSRSNPIDMIGDATAKQFHDAAEICAKAQETNCLLALLAPTATIAPSQAAQSLVDVSKENACPIITAWMGGPQVEKGREILNQAGIPTFDTAERAVRAFKNLYQYTKNIELLQEIPAKLPNVMEFDRPGAKLIIEDCIAEKRGLLSEIKSKKLLSAYGIPVNITQLAASKSEAVRAAKLIGFPIAMKINSRDISHKSDAGCVEINLTDASDVGTAYDKIVQNASTYAPNALIQGVTVQAMSEGSGIELILGVKKDKEFGPVILFGMGGVLTEVFRDHALALPPMNRLLAKRLMEETKTNRILKGYRNIEPANLILLEEILIRLSQLAVDFPEIEELDINPLIVRGQKAIAVDARVLLRTDDAPAGSHLVISPYPKHLEFHKVTQGNVKIFIRPIRPEDAPLLEALFDTLSAQSIYYRFFTPMKQLPHKMLARFTQIDYDRQVAFVALPESAHGEKLLGVARVIVSPNQKAAEFSVLVGDPWQGKGIGAELLKQCLLSSKQLGIQNVCGTVLSDNTKMISLARKLGCRIKKVAGANEYEMFMDISNINL